VTPPPTTPSDPFPIRLARSEEIARILDLAARPTVVAPSPWRDADGMSCLDRSTLAATLQAQTEDPAVLVAAPESEVAGFAQFRRLTDVSNDRPTPMSPTWWSRPPGKGGVGLALLGSAAD